MPDETRSAAPKPLFPLAGCKLLITVEDGYVKAYASPNDEAGVLSYGLEGRDARDGVYRLVEDFLEANGV